MRKYCSKIAVYNLKLYCHKVPFQLYEYSLISKFRCDVLSSFFFFNLGWNYCMSIADKESNHILAVLILCCLKQCCFVIILCFDLTLTNLSDHRVDKHSVDLNKHCLQWQTVGPTTSRVGSPVIVCSCSVPLYCALHLDC